ncbi:MAG: toll/interleukin-1 receptor domain-containing protein [Desulfobacterales bacterium]|nr:toll/interleukin-1 receptor domain-containing protein [Desulfobacterales bacterium]
MKNENKPFLVIDCRKVHFILEICTGIIYFPVMSAKVFISYGEEDYQVAKKLYDDLKGSGFDPWMDREDILGGRNRKQEIRKAILKSSYFLVLLSEKPLSDRGYFHKELKTALEILDEVPPDKIFILPVRLDACKVAYENLQNIQYTDLFPSYDEGFRQIVRALENPGDEKGGRRFVSGSVLEKPTDIRIEGGIHQHTHNAKGSHGSSLLTLLCFVIIAGTVTVILFVFFPIETKGKASWEQAIPAILCAFVFCSVILTLANAYKSIPRQSGLHDSLQDGFIYIILLVYLCIGFSMIPSAFLLNISPLEIIRVIVRKMDIMAIILAVSSLIMFLISGIVYALSGILYAASYGNEERVEMAKRSFIYGMCISGVSVILYTIFLTVKHFLLNEPLSFVELLAVVILCWPLLLFLGSVIYWYFKGKSEK